MHADCGHHGAKASDDVGLLRRPTDLCGERGHQAIVKQAAVDAGKWKNQIGASLVTSAERSIAARKP
jgi:hypothetical protein